MKLIPLSFAFVLLVLTGNSQCTYLAYDGFNYTPMLAMHGLSGGSGWQGPWEVQNDNNTIPGYQIVASSLTYGDLQTTGNHAGGAKNYLTAGRRLQTTDSGPFSDYVAEYENGIGTQTGDTLYVSFLLSKSENNNQPVYTDLHNDNISWCSNCASQHIGIGYFGASSNANNQKWWTLKLNNTYHLSAIPVITGAHVFFVARIIFNSGNTKVDLFINPPTLGFVIPNTPTVSASTGTGNIIRSMAVYLGDASVNGKIDEIRMASSYACAAPDDTITINLPPVAIISASPQTGQIPLSVSLNGSNSSDPEGQPLSFLWNFGDGTGTSTQANTSHLYNTTGEIDVSLTVTDPQGLQHTTYITLVLLDDNNTYSCQTTVTCLQMASCGQNNGAVSVHVNNAAFALFNNLGIQQPVTNNDEFHNLAPGTYHLYVDGNNSSCTDSIDLKIITDSTTCQGWQPLECSMQIGTNLSGLSDWSVERPFKNLFKNIRPEVIGYAEDCYCWDSGVFDQMSFDESGYPTFIPQITSEGNTFVRYVISSSGGNLREDSTYVVLYDGEGDISIDGNASIVSSTEGRLVFIPQDNGNFALSITASQLENHIHNIRIVRLADEADNILESPFYDLFLNRISPFTVLRFMDWGATNNSQIEQWSERGKVGWFTYATSAGVPYEMMIKLVNQQHKDIWVCVPHLADSTYIAEMATLFRDSLNANVNIYLEYSNELWNWIFEQAQYNNENRPTNLNYGRAGAEKAKKVFEIWHEVFGEERCRVKRVLGLQAGYNGLNEDILYQLKKEEWDLASPSFYFGLDHSENGNPVLNQNSTVTEIMQNASNAWEAFRPTVRQDYLNIKLAGKEIVGYEGGQHFVGNVFGNPYPYQQAMWDAQNSQEMYDFYNKLLDTIRRWNCRVAIHFTLASDQESVYGSWGALPDIDAQPPFTVSARKYQSLLDNNPSASCHQLLVWEGKQSTSWHHPCNWQPNRSPGESSTVIIKPNTPHVPWVDEDAVVKKVILLQSALLNILTGKTLFVKG